MKKTVRVYLASFIDIELDSEDFNDNKDMKHYAREYWTDYADKEEIWDNLEISYDEPDVFNEDGSLSY